MSIFESDRRMAFCTQNVKNEFSKIFARAFNPCRALQRTVRFPSRTYRPTMHPTIRNCSREWILIYFRKPTITWFSQHPTLLLPFSVRSVHQTWCSVPMGRPACERFFHLKFYTQTPNWCERAHIVPNHLHESNKLMEKTKSHGIFVECVCSVRSS